MKTYTSISIIFLMIALILAIVGFNYRSFVQSARAGAEAPVAEHMAEELGKKYRRPKNMVQIIVDTETETFAKGTVLFANNGGDGLWFAAKTGNSWELAFDGNGIIPCEAANLYRFPKDMVPQCLDAENGNALIRR